MTLSLDLSSSRAKIARAREHLEALNRELPEKLKKDGPYAIRFSDVDPVTGWCEMFIVPNKAKEPRFGVIVGDMMHNLRSALDYVVTALVDASHIKLASNHQFPIFVSKTVYGKKVGTPSAPLRGGYLGGVKYGVGLIEQLQPYHLKPNPRADPLFDIHRFSNADKHREIAAFLPIPQGSLDIKFDGTVVEKDHITEITNFSPDEECLIHRMRFDPPVARNLRVVSDMSLLVGFTTPKFGREPVHSIRREVFGKLCDHVAMVVEQFESL